MPTPKPETPRLMLGRVSLPRFATGRLRSKLERKRSISSVATPTSCSTTMSTLSAPFRISFAKRDHGQRGCHRTPMSDAAKCATQARRGGLLLSRRSTTTGAKLSLPTSIQSRVSGGTKMSLPTSPRATSTRAIGDSTAGWPLRATAILGSMSPFYRTSSSVGSSPSGLKRLFTNITRGKP